MRLHDTLISKTFLYVVPLTEIHNWIHKNNCKEYNFEIGIHKFVHMLRVLVNLQSVLKDSTRDSFAASLMTHTIANF